MNFENMNALSQKVEGVLGTVRTLKQENAKFRKELEMPRHSCRTRAFCWIPQTPTLRP